MDPKRSSPDVRFAFDHDPSASRQARTAIEPLLSDKDDPIADDVQLTVSELVTNVVRHTEDGGLLEAWDPRPDVPLRVEVSDTDQQPVQLAQDRLVGQGGHGLHIVESVSDRWGVELKEHGKTVWAEFDRNRRSDT